MTPGCFIPIPIRLVPVRQLWKIPILVGNGAFNYNFVDASASTVAFWVLHVVAYCGESMCM